MNACKDFTCYKVQYLVSIFDRYLSQYPQFRQIAIFPIPNVGLSKSEMTMEKNLI